MKYKYSPARFLCLVLSSLFAGIFALTCASSNALADARYLFEAEDGSTVACLLAEDIGQTYDCRDINSNAEYAALPYYYEPSSDESYEYAAVEASKDRLGESSDRSELVGDDVQEAAEGGYFAMGLGWARTFNDSGVDWLDSVSLTFEGGYHWRYLSVGLDFTLTAANSDVSINYAEDGYGYDDWGDYYDYDYEDRTQLNTVILHLQPTVKGYWPLLDGKLVPMVGFGVGYSFLDRYWQNSKTSTWTYPDYDDEISESDTKRDTVYRKHYLSFKLQAGLSYGITDKVRIGAVTAWLPMLKDNKIDNSQVNLELNVNVIF